MQDLEDYIIRNGQQLEVITIDDEYFKDAPTLLHYTKAMYYRLLAFRFLPEDLDRILYLDPDILVINPLRELYETDLTDYLYAAAYHDLISVKEINRIRLMPYEIEAYYNSGVLLMNLDLQRKSIEEKEIYDFVVKTEKTDNARSGYSKLFIFQKIKTLDEKLYNYDARYYRYYKLLDGEWDMDAVIKNTVIIHFCGKKSPGSEIIVAGSMPYTNIMRKWL